MSRSTTNGIAELIVRLGSRHRATVDAARARLAVIGERAAEHLIEALEGGDHRVRLRAISLLALIQDPRGRAPLVAMLLDRSVSLREAAARSLARFPSPETVRALVQALDRERSAKVRAAAVQSLIEQYASGRDEAVAPVLQRMTDTDESAVVRHAALALLPLLGASQRRGLVAGFEADPCAEFRRRAAEVILFEPGRGDRPDRERIEARVLDLSAEDYAQWNSAVQQLSRLGAAAVEPLVAEMHRRAHDPEFCTRAGMALKAMGPRRGRAVADQLDCCDEPLPLQVLVEAIGAMGDKALIYRLNNLIERLAALPRTRDDTGALDLMQRVRAKAHLELARIGSRVAIQDLRVALADPDRRVELEMLAAVERVGTRDEIGVLLMAFGREDRFMRERIADVVRAVMKRERIRRNSRIFRQLTADQRRSLESILPPPRKRDPGRRPPRASRPEPAVKPRGGRAGRVV